jgi:hypothetical protein
MYGGHSTRERTWCIKKHKKHTDNGNKYIHKNIVHRNEQKVKKYTDKARIEPQSVVHLPHARPFLSIQPPEDPCRQPPRTHNTFDQ